MSHEIFYFIGTDEKEDWPESVKKHIPSIIDGKITDSTFEEGPVFTLQAPTIYECLLRVNAKKVLEVGRRKGVSTRILIDAVKKTGGHIWSIDIDDLDTKQDLPKEDHKYLTTLHGNVINYAFDENFDFIFIDTFHTYLGTLAELDACWPLLKEPGIMIVHKVDSHFGAKRAVIEWSETRKLGFIMDTRGQGMAIFLKPCYPIRLRDRLTKDSISTS